MQSETRKTHAMSYSFFLFTKLHGLYKKSGDPYDVQFEEVLYLFESWQAWDLDNGKSIGEYESMCEFLSIN